MKHAFGHTVVLWRYVIQCWLLSDGPFETNFNEIRITNITSMSSAKCRPFRFRLGALIVEGKNRNAGPSQITKFMGPTWGPPGSCRPQMGPMLALWTLLTGIVCFHQLMGNRWIAAGSVFGYCDTSYNNPYPSEVSNNFRSDSHDRWLISLLCSIGQARTVIVLLPRSRNTIKGQGQWLYFRPTQSRSWLLPFVNLTRVFFLWIGYTGKDKCPRSWHNLNIFFIHEWIHSQQNANNSVKMPSVRWSMKLKIANAIFCNVQLVNTHEHLVYSVSYN